MKIDNLPRPTVELDSGGNAIAVVMTVRKALVRAGWTREQADAFRQEALSGDYDNVLKTCMKYAEIE